MNKTETAKIIAVIRALWPTAAQPADQALQLEIWTDSLADLDYLMVDQAIRNHHQTSKWPPAVSEIREFCVNATHGPVRRGGEAWRDFLDEVGRTGSYRSPSFDDPIVAKVVRSLGWRELCLSENQVADRARFIELYDQLAARERTYQQSPVLREAEERRQLSAASETVSQVARILTRGTSRE